MSQTISFTKMVTKDHFHHKAGEPNHQPTQEKWLLVAMLDQAIKDYYGVAVNWDKHCLSCHADQPCGHFVTGDRKIVAGRGKIGRRGTFKDCLYFHTHQQCAVTYFDSEAFEQVCGWLGFSPAWFRRILPTLKPQTGRDRRPNRTKF